jgi:hypothetical protein
MDFRLIFYLLALLTLYPHVYAQDVSQDRCTRLLQSAQAQALEDNPQLFSLSVAQLLQLFETLTITDIEPQRVMIEGLYDKNYFNLESPTYLACSDPYLLFTEYFYEEKISLVPYNLGTKKLLPNIDVFDFLQTVNHIDASFYTITTGGMRGGSLLLVNLETGEVIKEFDNSLLVYSNIQLIKNNSIVIENGRNPGQGTSSSLFLFEIVDGLLQQTHACTVYEMNFDETLYPPARVTYSFSPLGMYYLYRETLPPERPDELNSYPTESQTITAQFIPQCKQLSKVIFTE